MGEAGGLKFTGGNSTHMNGASIHVLGGSVNSESSMAGSVSIRTGASEAQDGSSGSLRLETSSLPVLLQLQSSQGQPHRNLVKLKFPVELSKVVKAATLCLMWVQAIG